MKISDLIKNLILRARTIHPCRYSFMLLLSPFDYMRFRPAIEKDFDLVGSAFYYQGIRVSMCASGAVEIGSPRIEVI